jgi:hypothetical protein
MRIYKHYQVKKSTKRRLNKAIGVGLVAAGAIGISLYGWLVFFSPWQILILHADDICGNGRRLQHTGLGGACTNHHTPAEVHSGDRKKSRKHWKNSKDHATQLLAADAANCNQNQILKALVVP